jgi:hypothetical protein
MLAAMNGINRKLPLRETMPARGFLPLHRNYSKLPVTPWKPFMACFPSHFMTRATL